MQVQTHITEVIEEAIQRRVRNTIQEYADKNVLAFSANKIAGVQFELNLTVLVDNLGLNPQPRASFIKRFINAVKRFLR